MANNFELALLSNQSIVSGDAESFCSGTGSVTLTRTGGRNNGIQIKGLIWDKVATIKWHESDYSLSSNIGYYDSARNWTKLNPTLSWNGRNLTITNLNIPSGELELFVGQDSAADVTYSNLEILDADGNSLLESTEPSTGLPLYIGDSNIQAVKLGNVDISKMYIGDTLIYSTGAVNNNFKIKFSSSTTVDGDLEQFATGYGIIDVNTGDYTMGNMYIYKLNDNISWQDIKTLGFDRAELISPTSRGSSYPTWYLQDDSQGFKTFTSPTVSSTSVIANNINIPAYYQQIRYLYTPIRPEGSATNGVYRISNLKILDSNGNSLL